jgi:hypothetical protein
MNAANRYLVPPAQNAKNQREPFGSRWLLLYFVPEIPRT